MGQLGLIARIILRSLPFSCILTILLTFTCLCSVWCIYSRRTVDQILDSVSGMLAYWAWKLKYCLKDLGVTI